MSCLSIFHLEVQRQLFLIRRPFVGRNWTSPLWRTVCEQAFRLIISESDVILFERITRLIAWYLNNFYTTLTEVKNIHAPEIYVALDLMQNTTCLTTYLTCFKHNLRSVQIECCIGSKSLIYSAFAPCWLRLIGFKSGKSLWLLLLWYSLPNYSLFIT